MLAPGTQGSGSSTQVSGPTESRPETAKLSSVGANQHISPSPPTGTGHEALDARGERGVLGGDVVLGAEELGGLGGGQPRHAHL